MQASRDRQNLVKIRPKENFSAAEGEKQCSGAGEVFHHGNAFGRRQLPMVVVIQITMHAAFVAAVSQIEMHAERPALFYRARNQTVHHGRGTRCGSDGHRDSPTVAGTSTSNFLEDISSNSDCVSVKATSGATS